MLHQAQDVHSNLVGCSCQVQFLCLLIPQQHCHAWQGTLRVLHNPAGARVTTGHGLLAGRALAQLGDKCCRQHHSS